MRRAGKIALSVAGALVAVPVLLVALVLLAANTGPGRAEISALVARLTGGTVVAQGIGGTFPTDLRIRHVELRDARGLYAVAENLRLVWSPLRLLSHEVAARSLTADGIHVLRLPVSATPGKGAAARKSSFTLPVRVVVQRLAINRLELDPPVAGTVAALAVSGHLTLDTLTTGSGAIAITRLDMPGDYRVAGRIDAARIAARLTAQEPAHGLVATASGLPDLGSLALSANVDGPRSALATRFDLAAGPLHADGHGTVDLAASRADLDIAATAPAMAPRPDLSWQAVGLDAHVSGAFARPDATGQLRVFGLHAGGGTVGTIVADLSGNRGAVALRAILDGLRLPGPQAGLLGAAPLLFQAQMRLDRPDRPVAFALAHPLLRMAGTAETGGALSVQAALTLPDLAPFAAIGGVDLHGHTALTLRAATADSVTTATIDGNLAVLSGPAPAPALLGPDTTYHVAAKLDGQIFDLTALSIAGAKVRLDAHGRDDNGALDLAYDASLPDLAALAPSLTGDLAAKGTVRGRHSDLTVAADLSGAVGAPGVPRGPISATLRAQGLPGAPTGQITARGSLAGAPLAVDAAVSRAADGTLHAAITRATWKSADVSGAFAMAKGATLPTGAAKLRMSRLADLAPFVGQNLAGSLQADANLTAQAATLHVQANGAGVPAGRVGRIDLVARITDPTTHPMVSADLTASGIAAGKIGGSAKVSVSGPRDALGVTLAANLTGLAGEPARISGAARVDTTTRQVTLQRLLADWHGEALRLLAPARIALAPGMAVDRLRIGVGAAVIDLEGRISPTLALTATARGLTPALVKPFAPTLAAAGMIDATARLAGTTARPTGTVTLTASGLRLLSGPAGGVPPARLRATLALAGTTARLDAHLDAGASHLAIAGPVPLTAAGALDLRMTGRIDLALTDPFLTPSGRQARGVMTLDVLAGGTLAAPALSGGATLAGGEFQDYVQGVHLTAISARLLASGTALRIASLTARAGPGTIAIAGTVGALAPGIPVDLTITAHRARPLVSDLLTADLDAQLAVHGHATGALSLGGTIRVLRATINIPNKLGGSVPTLDVHFVGEKPPPPPTPAPPIALDLTLDAPGQVFVRGHGLDAELGGQLHVGGTAAEPQISGGFSLRYGTFSLAGTTLNFSRGRITFTGTGLAHKIDPALDFQANSTQGSVTASIIIGGYADAPTFRLTSSPALPQDEVLAHLLFGRSVKDLGPFQYAQIAQALASLSGAGSSVIDPLSSIRSGLGLDRLNVSGGTPNGVGPSVEGGKYVSRGVFVGAKQGTGGSNSAGTQAEVQVDLWRGLKLNSTAGSGPGGNSVGLSYQFNY